MVALVPKRLPTLTLFTSGPLCSLCDVAKADLADVQKVQPFHLKLYDIRRKLGDKEDPEEYERTAWRRLYQYDVPVLHYSAEATLDSLAGRKRARTRSPSPALTVPPAKRTTRERAVSVTPPPASPNEGNPPLFLVTASPSAIVDDSHYASFGHGFSYEYHGADLPLHRIGEPLVPLGEQTSEQDVLSADNLNHLVPVAACFNCGYPGHQLSDWPFARDQVTISSNRDRFRSEKADLSALGFAPSRRLGASTGESDSAHQRFLDYADRFKPGVVSDELRSALGYGGISDRFVTREWPWMHRILDYGYLRGWTMRTGDPDPFSRIRQHIWRIAQDFGRSDVLITLDDVTDLEIYDGHNGLGTKPLPTEPLEAGSPSLQNSESLSASTKLRCIRQSTDASRLAHAESSTSPYAFRDGLGATVAALPSPPPDTASSPAPPPLRFPPSAPPPLPAEALPPLPPDDLPPLPPPTTTSEPSFALVRLVDYRSSLFDSCSHWLAFSPEEYYLSFNRPSPRDGRRPQRIGPQTSREQIKSVGDIGRAESEAGTEDMEMSSSDGSA